MVVDVSADKASSSIATPALEVEPAKIEIQATDKVEQVESDNKMNEEPVDTGTIDQGAVVKVASAPEDTPPTPEDAGEV